MSKKFNLDGGMNVKVDLIGGMTKNYNLVDGKIEKLIWLMAESTIKGPEVMGNALTRAVEPEVMGSALTRAVEPEVVGSAPHRRGGRGGGPVPVCPIPQNRL
ncbi:hypothetical protein AVEN_127674-1 [Araneus ventricosus]|uniref:Uncharacterized protein n=1 Tax=Araneus ventricosus TaxID=182803 RepID=A0A4Y2Q0P8_ARAVE|nr:hypothetical protein AVEN_127674-1 [Araneus ventricosus]